MRGTIITMAVAGVMGATFMLGACASQPKGNQVAQQNKTHMVCFSTTSIGSHISKTTCMTEENYASYKKQQEKAAEQERTQLQQRQNQGNQGGGGGG